MFLICPTHLAGTAIAHKHKLEGWDALTLRHVVGVMLFFVGVSVGASDASAQQVVQKLRRLL